MDNFVVALGWSGIGCAAGLVVGWLSMFAVMAAVMKNVTQDELNKAMEKKLASKK